MNICKNKCEVLVTKHYNMINKTGKTRRSFDFRVLPINYYDENYKSENYVPMKFMKLEDDERRGLIRGLRWVLEDDLEDLS